MPPARKLWHDPDFVKLWFAQATGLIGQQFSVLAVPLVAIVTLDTDPATVALLGFAFNAPWLVFGLFVGVLVDRWPRRRLLIGSDLARAVAFATIPVAAVLGMLTIEQLFVLALVIGTLDMCWLTAYRTYVPGVVPEEHRAQAYALVGASDGVTRTAAPSLAGGLIQLLGPPAGVGITSGTYVASAIANGLIRRAEPPSRDADQHPVRAFKEGLATAWRERTIRALALSEATYIFFWASTQSVLLVFLSDDLGLAPGVIGLVFTLGTLGGLLGAALARPVGRRLGERRAIVLGNVLRSVGMASMPLAAVLGPLAVPALMVTRLLNSFGWTVWEVHRETVQQRLLADAVRGRVNGTVLFVGGAALAAGMAAGAGVVALVGVVPTLVLGGVGTLLATVWLRGAGQMSSSKSPRIQPM
jgi:MFS family permease